MLPISLIDAIDLGSQADGAGGPPGHFESVASVPRWAQIVGVLLLLAFLALSVEAYFGPGLRYRLPTFGAGLSTRSQAVPPRVYYEPGSAVHVGQPGVGSAGQDRVFLEGDSVLLGSTGQVVRLEPGGRVADLDAAVAELRDHGLDVSDPSPVASNRQAFVHDPAGNMVELHEAGSAA